VIDMDATHSLADSLVALLSRVIGPAPVALHEPYFEGNELEYLKECIDSTYVSSIGKFVDRFEYELANFTGAKYAVSTVNGTSALQIALLLAGVQNGDEVLMPALTFVATANAAVYCNANPHFVDSEESTFGIDAGKLNEYLLANSELKAGLCVNKNTGRIIRALVPMHAFGHPSNLSDLVQVARDFRLVLVEDAAESLGSYYKGQHTGTFGLLGTLSFNGNKTITTGGGGAVLTNSAELAKQAKHLITTAKISHAWEYRHDQVGYNYRMPNLNAALGCAQIEQLPNKLAVKRKLFEKYREAFENFSGVSLFKEPQNCSSNYWLQTLLLDTDKTDELESILHATNIAGYITRPAWSLLSELDPFKKFPHADLSAAQFISRRIINIPSNTRFDSKR
jgi:perosamine synthetase